MHNITPTPCKI